MLIDLHNHTRLYSPCSILEPREIVDAAARAGFDGVAITEHDAWFPAALARRFSTDRVTVIPGCELTAGRHHVLAFGEGLQAGPYADLETLLASAAGLPVALVLAHPFRWHSPLLALPEDGLAAVFRRFHAVEVASCNLDEHRRRTAVRFCAAHRIPMVAGSDAHGPEMLARFATHFPGTAIRDSVSLALALAGGGFEPFVQDNPAPE